MTSSADCTRASSVPQMAMPAWVTTASSGTSRDAISVCRSARYSAGRSGSAASASAASASSSARAWPPASRSQSPWPAAPEGPARQRLRRRAMAGHVQPERRRTAASCQRRQRGAQPSEPARRGGVASRLGPAGELVPVDPGRAAAQPLGLEPRRQLEMRPPRPWRAGDQRMLGDREEIPRGQRRSRQRREHPQQHPGGRQGQRAPGAVVRDQPPAVELRAHPPRQPAVGRHQRRARAPLGRVAERQRDRARLGAQVRRLDPGDAGTGGVQACRRAVCPSLRHWSVTGAGRNASETSALRAGAGGGASCQGGTAAGSKPSASASRRKPCCGWSAAPASAAPSRAQTAGGRPAIVAGQHQRALRQPRHRRHEGARGAPRSGRAGDDHRMRRRRGRPGGGVGVRDGAHAPLALARPLLGDVALQQREEAQAALPVVGVLRRIDRGERRRRDSLALHLVEQVREAVGKIEGGGLGGEPRLGPEQPRHQAGELEPAAEVGHRRRQVDRRQRVRRELGDDPDARQAAAPGPSAS